MKPISPAEAAPLKKTILPVEVIAAFNELIALHLCNGESTIKQDDVVALILEKMNVNRSEAQQVQRQDVFDHSWLDVDDIYRAEGWVVTYDKPGYCETYSATFTFKAKGKK